MTRQVRSISAMDRLLASRKRLTGSFQPDLTRRKDAAEGGCGVIGMACSEPIPGRHLLQSLRQMRNRGNGKGGGAALVGLEPSQLGVDQATLNQYYLIAVAYLDLEARAEVERNYIHRYYDVASEHILDPKPLDQLDMPPPFVVIYFGLPNPERFYAFVEENDLTRLPDHLRQDEYVFQTTFRLNQEYYASLGEKRAFVLSHGKDMLVLKMVGFGDDVIQAYQLQDLNAHVWIGHHRYPTKGRVWHPGGAHPFIGMHDALVHNGDFANYASVCSYLAQFNLKPQFLTDTEVSVLMFDLLHRTFQYPLEYVIESLAPTTERDFAQLDAEKQAIYRQLQVAHMHGSPDGPWFFLIAQSLMAESSYRTARLIGITDTSMLRPQVFALQEAGPDGPSIGLAASEKQAIDAALTSLAGEDDRFWSHPDVIWNARGGSHTDGGAFVFSVDRDETGRGQLVCLDKFGRVIEAEVSKTPIATQLNEQTASGDLDPSTVELESLPGIVQSWNELQWHQFLSHLALFYDDRRTALDVLTILLDRVYPTGSLRRSTVDALISNALTKLLYRVSNNPDDAFTRYSFGMPLPSPTQPGQSVVIDATGFASEGEGSLAFAIQDCVRSGFNHLVVLGCRGHRFIGNGLGPQSEGVRIDVYGSSGDYLGSGLDGAEVIVHGHGQDQLAQIMKSGKLVVHGDVGQTFMYAAKGGQVFVQGSAAGRPLINAVGKPKVVINGTCLDYLAESFMAGDPLDGGGFVVLNGVKFDRQGILVVREDPYPGGNLFSLASGGAIFIRDPHQVVGEDQLNGGTFVPFDETHWNLVRPLLEENERLFGIALEWLLSVDGERRKPGEVYRTIIPVRNSVLQPEQAWVKHE
jgi:glutamate synthase domain-containing protein 1/glutamate synthase domain-containing protein 3